MKFYWTKNEFGCPELTKKYADKFAHAFLHYVIMIIACLWFKQPLWFCVIISLTWGILYEYIVDCIILKHGASWTDLISNVTGMVLGFLTLIIGGF